MDKKKKSGLQEQKKKKDSEKEKGEERKEKKKTKESTETQCSLLFSLVMKNEGSVKKLQKKKKTEKKRKSSSERKRWFRNTKDNALEKEKELFFKGKTSVYFCAELLRAIVLARGQTARK